MAHSYNPSVMALVRVEHLILLMLPTPVHQTAMNAYKDTMNVKPLCPGHYIALLMG